MLAPRRSLLLLSLALAAGCGRCSTQNNSPDAAPPAPSATAVSKEELLPPPAPWTFKPARLGPGLPSFALPEGCSLRGPTLRASVRATTRFVAIPSAPQTLVIADADPAESPPRLTGVAGVRLEPEAPAQDITPLPWREADAMPRLAKAPNGTWLAAYSEQGEGRLSTVFLYQNQTVTPIGEGDRFDAADLVCRPERCALLTTRLANVAVSGAELWLGGPSEPPSSWKKIEIAPSKGETNARPSVLARVDPTGAVVVMFEGEELVFWQADEASPPRELGRVPAPHGMIDATITSEPLALVYGAAVDDEGCANEGGKIHFVRPGKDPVEIRAHAPPTSGALRPLERGILATYLAPLGCGVERKVVYAVVLDPAGAPISAPMPVADASSFAASVHGKDVDLWIQLGDEVTWLRATCAAP